jgi:hypothetical protein
MIKNDQCNLDSYEEKVKKADQLAVRRIFRRPFPPIAKH